jgi:hypothetical protein
MDQQRASVTDAFVNGVDKIADVERLPQLDLNVGDLDLVDVRLGAKTQGRTFSRLWSVTPPILDKGLRIIGLRGTGSISHDSEQQMRPHHPLLSAAPGAGGYPRLLRET